MLIKLDNFPSIYVMSKEGDIPFEKCVKIHYLLVNKILKNILINKEVFNFLGTNLKFRNHKIKKTKKRAKKIETLWEKEKYTEELNLYWKNIEEYMLSEMEAGKIIDFFDLFYIYKKETKINFENSLNGGDNE